MSEEQGSLKRLAELTSRLNTEPPIETVVRLLASLYIDGMAVCQIESGEIEWCDDGLVSITGYTRHELIGRCVDLLVPDDLRVKHEQLRQQFARNVQSRKMGTGPVLHLKHKTGLLLPCHIGLSPQVEGRVAIALQMEK